MSNSKFQKEENKENEGIRQEECSSVVLDVEKLTVPWSILQRYRILSFSTCQKQGYFRTTAAFALDTHEKNMVRN